MEWETPWRINWEVMLTSGPALKGEGEEEDEEEMETNYLGQNSIEHEHVDGEQDGDSVVTEALTMTPDETAHEMTTSHEGSQNTPFIATSITLETRVPTTSVETTTQVDITDDGATTTTTTTVTTTATPAEAAATTASGQTTSALSDENGFANHGSSCFEPAEQRLRLSFKQSNQNVKFPALAILGNENADDETEYGNNNDAAELPGADSSGRSQVRRAEYVNMTCPQELLHVTRSDDLSARSLCPWSNVEDFDPNRYPSRIMFAVCRCPHCIQIGQGDDFSYDNTCRQIFFRMKVLRKGSCVNGLYVYNTEYQDIPVACACIRPKES